MHICFLWSGTPAGYQYAHHGACQKHFGDAFVGSRRGQIPSAEYANTLCTIAIGSAHRCTGGFRSFVRGFPSEVGEFRIKPDP